MTSQPSTDTEMADAFSPAESVDVSRAMSRGIAWTAIQTTGSNLMSLTVFIVLGRLLTPRDFGLLASATVVILFLRVLVDAGFSRLIVQRQDITAEHIDTAFWTALGMGLTFCVLLAAAAPLVALVFGEPRLTGIVRALSLVFIFVAMDGTQSAILERRMEFRSQAIRRLVAGITSAVVAIALAILGAGVWALVAQQLTLEAVTVIVLWSLAPWRPRLRFSRSCFRELASFGVRYSASQVLLYLNGNADNFLIGVVLGPVALGYYVVAYRVFVVATEVLVMTINRVALTTFSRFQGNDTALNAAFTSATTMTAYITLPCFAALALLAHPLITILFGTKWAASIPVLQVLTVAGVVQGQSNFAGNYAIALGRMANQLVWLSVVVAIQILAFAATVSLGVVAVAASLSVVTLIAWPIRVLQLSRWRHLSVWNYFKQFPGLLVATGAMVATMWAIGQLIGGGAAGVLVAVQMIVGAIAYLLATLVLAPSAMHAFRATLLQLRR